MFRKHSVGDHSKNKKFHLNKTAKIVSRSTLEEKLLQHEQVLTHIQCMTDHTPYAKTNEQKWLSGTKPDMGEP